MHLIQRGSTHRAATTDDIEKLISGYARCSAAINLHSRDPGLVSFFPY
jgi:hypothetical protein